MAHAVLLAALALAAAPKPNPPRRTLVQRTVQVTDTSGVVELHLAKGISTTLVFPLEVLGTCQRE